MRLSSSLCLSKLIMLCLLELLEWQSLFSCKNIGSPIICFSKYLSFSFVYKKCNCSFNISSIIDRGYSRFQFS